MECPDITTLEQAEAKLPSSVLPIRGLRRKDDGLLTEDAINTIMDGLKSRGVNFTNSDEMTKITNDLTILLCSSKKQYDFLVNAYSQKTISPTDEQLKTILDKNFTVTDIITIFRRIQETTANNSGNPDMVEGWQNMNTLTNVKSDSNDKLMKKLARDRALLEGFTSGDLRDQQLNMSQEKIKMASNYLAMYGFLNLFAVGLILYLAASK